MLQQDGGIFVLRLHLQFGQLFSFVYKSVFLVYEGISLGFSTAVSDALPAPAQMVSFVSVNFTYFFIIMLPDGPIKNTMLTVVTATAEMIMP